MTVSEIFTLLLDSKDLKVELNLPSDYTVREIEKLKRDISNYKSRNKERYEPILGECTLSFTLRKDWVLVVEIAEVHPKATKWDGVTLAKG